MPEALKSQDERRPDSKTAPWAGGRLTPARACPLAFTAHLLEGGLAKLKNPNRPQSTVGRGVLNPDISTAAAPGFLGEELAPGREGARILIVWIASAPLLLGWGEEGARSLEEAKARPRSPPAGISKAAHFPGRGVEACWQLASSPSNLPPPHFRSPFR